MAGKRNFMENVTPLKQNNINSRSRKCLDLAIEKVCVTPSSHGSPLRDRKNLLVGQQNTPERDLILSSSPVRSPSPSYPLSQAPSLMSQAPCTPLARRTNLSSSRLGVASPMVRVSTKKRVKGSVKKEKVKIQKEAEEVQQETKENLVGIVCSNFYANSCQKAKNGEFDFLRVTGGTASVKSMITPNMTNTTREVRSQPGPRRSQQAGTKRSQQTGSGMRRSTSSGSLRRRSTGGVKRKREGGTVGHGIKKPRIRHRAESVKVKISELPALSIEIPKSKPSPCSSTSVATSFSTLPISTITTPSRGISSAGNRDIPTSGHLKITNQTKVQYEVKGGEFVYRATPKAGITPLRRSPRKHFSPLKADYFSEKRRPESREGSKKLFSPGSDYLEHEGEGREGGEIPSPVKFDISQATSQDDSVPDFSELIASLGGTDSEASGEKLPPPQTVEGMEYELSSLQHDASLTGEVPVTPSTTFSQPLEAASSVVTSLSPDQKAASSAITSILCDLSSEGDSSIDANSSADSTTLAEQPETDPSKLFPIFYKNSADPGSVEEDFLTQVRSRKKFVCSSLDTDQAVIDAGQREMGPVVCQTCGVVFTLGDPEDELSHSRVHSGLLDKLRLTGWKSERVVGQFSAGRVLSVRPGDSSAWWKKVEEVLQVVDRDLGFSEVGIRFPDRTKVFLYLADKKVAGFLLAEEISQGFRILPNSGTESGKVYCCSESPEPVKCGISRIWVLADYRRRKIASSLVDSMRSSFFMNHYLSEAEFAFSDPTASGIEFASKYCKETQFLVYSR